MHKIKNGGIGPFPISKLQVIPKEFSYRSMADWIKSRNESKTKSNKDNIDE